MAQLEAKQAGNVKQTSEVKSIEQMRNLIINEIGGLSESDLNMMSNEQITSFYLELKSYTDQKNKQNALKEKQANSNIQNIQKVPDKQNENNVSKSNNTKNLDKKQISNNKQSQSQSNQTDIIKINQASYYKSKYISQNSYRLQNKRIAILYGPPIQNFQQKKKAVISCYNPSMTETIQNMNDQQIEDTYSRLRLLQGRKSFVVNYYQPFMREKQFCIYMPKYQLDQNTKNFFNSNKKQKQNNDIKQGKQKQKENKTQKITQQQNQKDVQYDQFFDQLIEKPPKTKKQQKEPKSDQKIKSLSHLKKAFESAKIKQKQDNSTQTQKQVEKEKEKEVQNKQKKEKKIKTQLTILRQVEYVQDFKEQSLEQRNRPLNNQQDLLNLPRKISLQQFKRALTCPEKQPQKQVLDWIKNLKFLVGQFQQSYLNQFKSNWKIINN